MSAYISYGIISVILPALELIYFKIADRFNIIDKPNGRSSHSTIVLRGGGVLFPLAVLVWLLIAASGGFADDVQVAGYLPFVIGLVLISGVSFADDIVSLPDGVRLVAQGASYILMFLSLGVFGIFGEYGILTGAGAVLLALIVCVGATNVYNFMDGINGITAGYSLAVLLPLLLLNTSRQTFIEQSLLNVTLLALVVFSFFNFRPKGKARCFAGDVGSISIAFILLFSVGRLILQTGDVTYLILMLIYGVDGCLTICHRILLHENLGQAHRKHAYQLMANELKIGHVKVSLLYMAFQIAVSLSFIYLCPNTIAAHWLYLVGAIVFLSLAYVAFMKKYYHLHEEYLAGLKT